jgi:hypothetical protein
MATSSAPRSSVSISTTIQNRILADKRFRDESKWSLAGLYRGGSGFLGFGEHYVAVSPSAVKVSYNDSDKKWHASVDASADQLKATPESKYAALGR